MIGYKATYNGKCKDQLYEVGKTYTFYDELIICQKGFHFCQYLYDVFTYYYPNKDIKVFKVEAVGNIKTESDKSVTNKIKILEEINLSNMIIEKNGGKYKFDKNKNLIEKKYSRGIVEKYEYDSNHNRIKYEDSYGYWEKREYNQNNKLIRIDRASGYWMILEYNENNEITYKSGRNKL
ncbi:hypothetical protein M0P65_05460 [Candidatus Gracilibacteria bacterium]|nr:hypothetical protein [Candidatus Gracilibacteria bacterium]